MKVARLRERSCAACGQPVANVDHVLQKGSPYHGDDVPANLIGLCGSGVDGCHGAKHGHTVVDAKGYSHLPASVRWRIGRYLVNNRQDVIAYVLAKLGDVPGRDYLARQYALEDPAEIDNALARAAA